MTWWRLRLFVSNEANADLQVLLLDAEKLGRTKEPNYYDGLQGGEGDKGARAAFVSAPQAKPSKGTLSSFQGASSALAQSDFL